MSSNFNNSGQRRVPTFSASQNLPKNDVKKGLDTLDAISAAMQKLYGSSSSSQQTATHQTAPETNVPCIPSNNRYAGHDQVVARIAKDLIDKLFVNIKARQWIPVSQKSLAISYKLEVRVQPDRIYLFGSGLDTYEVFFVNYGMRSVPDTAAFMYAIEPAMKYYCNESARTKFGNVHRLSDYEVSGRCYTYIDKTYMEFKIDQYFYPDRNLKSW